MVAEENKTSQMQIAGSGSDGSTSAIKERNANFGRTRSTVLTNKRSLRITPRVWENFIEPNFFELILRAKRPKQLRAKNHSKTINLAINRWKKEDEIII